MPLRKGSRWRLKAKPSVVVTILGPSVSRMGCVMKQDAVSYIADGESIPSVRGEKEFVRMFEELK